MIWLLFCRISKLRRATDTKKNVQQRLDRNNMKISLYWSFFLWNMHKHLTNKKVINSSYSSSVYFVILLLSFNCTCFDGENKWCTIQNYYNGLNVGNPDIATFTTDINTTIRCRNKVSIHLSASLCSCCLKHEKTD